MKHIPLHDPIIRSALIMITVAIIITSVVTFHLFANSINQSSNSVVEHSDLIDVDYIEHVNYDYSVCNFEYRCFPLDVERYDNTLKIYMKTPTQGVQYYYQNIDGVSNVTLPDFKMFCELGYDFSNKGICQTQLELKDLDKRVTEIEKSFNIESSTSSINERISIFKNECEINGNSFYYASDGYPKCNNGNHSHNMLIEMKLNGWWLDIGYESLQDWCAEVMNGDLRYFDDVNGYYYRCNYEKDGLPAYIHIYENGGWFQSLQELEPKDEVLYFKLNTEIEK